MSNYVVPENIETKQLQGDGDCSIQSISSHFYGPDRTILQFLPQLVTVT